MMRRKVLSSGLIVGMVGAYSVLCSFARNVVIARMIGPAEFGVAVMLATIASAIDILSDMGWDKFLIQNPQGHRPEALAVVHLLKLLSGAVFAVLILLLAPLIAQGIEKPGAALPLALLSIPALFRATMSVDYRRRQRDFDFKGEAWVEVSRYSADLLVAVVVGLIFKSYWAMFFAILAGGVVSCAVSHILATTPYRLTWHPMIGATALAFGGPLFANNLIVYGAGQGDRLLVGLGLDLQMLAIYAATLTLVAGGQVVISRLIISVGLPYLAARRNSDDVYKVAFLRTGTAVMIAALLLLVPVTLIGVDVVALFFGSRFRPPDSLVIAVALAQAFNIVRVWPTVGQMACGATNTIPLANMVRLAGLALAMGAVILNQNIVIVAYCIVAGEIAGAISALTWHHRVCAGAGWPVIARMIGFAAAIMAVLAIEAVIPYSPLLRLSIAVAGPLIIMLVAAIAVHEPLRGTFARIAGGIRPNIH